MSTIKYDPELPYAVILIGSGELNARFKYLSEAETHLGTATWLEVVDTTPKPKIPEDADYLIWEFEGETNMAYRDDNDWYASGEWWPTEDLVEALKDAEVTVLVRKEET